jgi:hypothetical protein
MRLFTVWFCLLCIVVLGAACSEQSSSRKDTAVNSQPTLPSASPNVHPTPKLRIDQDTTADQDIAAFLAGMPVSTQSNLHQLTKQPAWQAFATDADKSWLNYHQTRTTKMQQWAAEELDSVRNTSPTVFYPFSGPDLLNVATLFPTSQTYILVGLEPVGTIPQPSTLQDSALFPAIKASLWSILNFSFFRTNDMAVNLKSVELDGALPLLMLFAARTDQQVQAMRYVQLDSDGQLLPADTAVIHKPGPKVIPGVELKLTAKNGQQKTVYYFSADLSDWKLGVTKEAMLRYVRTLGPLTTYVKSATYLMHKLYFSKVRRLILENSHYILQDDSGIAMKYFSPEEWQFTYYGAYRRPINLFSKFYQPELTAAYQDSIHRPRSLPFGTGYNWRQNDSNLFLARRRVTPAS